MNHDQKLDVGAAGPNGDIAVLPGKGDGTFGAARTFASGGLINAFAEGDFNGDGVPDIALLSSQSPKVYLLVGTLDGAFAAPVSVALPGMAKTLVAGGVFGDGVGALCGPAADTPRRRACVVVGARWGG